MRVAFRVDGGSATIGMGHVARCAAMADALAARSAVIWFVCRDHENGVRYVRRRGFEVRAIPSTLALNEDLLQSIPLLADADLVVADSYEFDAAYLRGLAAAGKLIAAVTDVPDRELPVDIVIANAHATREEYSRRIRENAVLFAGPGFVPLRADFRRVPGREISERITRVLVTMGSADALNVTQRIIDLLEDYPRILFLDVLIGAEYGHGNALGHALQRSKHRYEIHRSVEDVVSLYQAVDVAITAAGVTLWELSSAGVPMLVVQTHEAQTGVAEYVRNERVATVLGWHERLTAPGIISALESLEEKKHRSRLSERGRKLVDGRGAERLAEGLSLAVRARIDH